MLAGTGENAVANRPEIAGAKPDCRAVDDWVTVGLIEWAVGTDGHKELEKLLKGDLRQVERDIAGPNPNAVEAVLARTAAFNWFMLRLLEAQYVTATTDKRLSFAASVYYQRLIDRAHRRLLTTLRTLSSVRRRTVPAVQINVGHNQLNQVSTARSPRSRSKKNCLRKPSVAR
jgi:hypothetical protein